MNTHKFQQGSVQVSNLRFYLVVLKLLFHQMFGHQGHLSLDLEQPADLEREIDGMWCLLVSKYLLVGKSITEKVQKQHLQNNMIRMLKDLWQFIVLYI